MIKQLCFAILFIMGVCSNQHLLSSSSETQCLISHESDPDSIVKSVQVTTGAFIQSEIDAIVRGPDPLFIRRSYNSQNKISRTNLAGWELFPHHCLYLQKDPKKSYTTAEGKYEFSNIYVRSEKGDIFCYSGWKNVTNTAAKSHFEMDFEKCLGISNIAGDEINEWTNPKNTKVYHLGSTDAFEVVLSNGGKRTYSKMNSEEFYWLQSEILPSGNKIFYQYDQGKLSYIEMKNSSESKIMSWIKFAYGKEIKLLTSDLQEVTYQYSKDSHNFQLLTKVIRSRLPTLEYEYEIIDERLLLTKRSLPEGRLTQIKYDPKSLKVQTVVEPLDAHQSVTTNFNYSKDEEEGGCTEVLTSENAKTLYRFDAQLQLNAIEEFLSGSLYRVHKKYWGKEERVGNLIGLSTQDKDGNTYYFKSFKYNELSNLTEEREYGNLTGVHPDPLKFDEEGNPLADQECHATSYSYETDKKYLHVGRIDIKGTKLHKVYKLGTNVLLGKMIITKGRWDSYSNFIRRDVYCYDDGSLKLVGLDNSASTDPELPRSARQCYFISITPKKELPNCGAPEILEEKGFDEASGKEILIRKIINHFDERGLINQQEIFDASGNLSCSSKMTYNEQGLLSFLIDSQGHEITYAYDSNQNLIHEKQITAGIAYDYEYDFGNHRIKATKHGQDGTSVSTLQKYDGADNIVISCEKEGQEVRYQYDNLGRLISATYPQLKVEPTSVITPTLHYVYDLFDNPVLITDSQGRTKRQAFTVRGQPISIQYPGGEEELFKYDTEGTLHRHRSKDGTTRVFEYDDAGRVIHIQRYPRGNKPNESESTNLYWNYDDLLLVSSNDENGIQTKYKYDHAGRRISQSVGGKKVSFEYDSKGRLCAQKRYKTDKIFSLLAKEYNDNNQLIEERHQDHLGNTLLKKRYTYDLSGRLKQIIGYPNNRESVLATYQYDGLGRIMSITDVLGQTTAISYQEDYINDLGQKVVRRALKDPLGNHSEEIFDSLGRIVQQIKKDSKGNILSQQECYYDSDGHKTYENYLRIPQSKNSKNYALRWKNEKKGLPSSISYSEGTANELVTNFSWNSCGDVTELYLPKNKVPVALKYDGLGQLVQFQFKDEKPHEALAYTLDYDQKGNLVSIKDDLFEIQNKIQDNQITQESIKVRKTNKSYSVSRSYDGEGLITSVKLPDGSSIEYIYQGALIVEIKRLSTDKQELYKHRIVSYDLMGNILEEIMPFNAGKRAHKWDIAARKTNICTDFFEDRVLEGGYDALNRLNKREIVFGESIMPISYEYNNLSQLTSEKGIVKRDYTYDSLNNRLSKDQELYALNDLNQTLQTGDTSYTFDLNGNLTSKTQGSSVFTYEYDPFGRLRICKDPQGNTLTFAYDALGRRLEKKVESKDKKVKIFRYFYLGDTELGCVNEQGEITELRIPLNPNHPERSSFIAFEFKKNVYVPIQDLQGNITCLVNPKQRKILESYRYSVFGEETIYNAKGEVSKYSPLENSWRYLSKRIDQETCLVHFRYRYYDPSIGRWITPDPLKSFDGPNLYAFAHNNPISFTDYYGLAAEVSASQNTEFLKYFHGEWEPHCACEAHRSCRRGGDIGNAIGGSLLGGTKFGFSVLRGLGELYGAAQMQDMLDQYPPDMQVMIREGAANALNRPEQVANEFIVENVEFDPSSELAIKYQKGTFNTLVVLDILRPTPQKVRGVLGYFKPLVSIKKTTGIIGWKVGDSINNLTLKGNIPSWPTVRARHWKNRAFYYPDQYSPENLARMRKGLANQRKHPITGIIESQELHHNPPQREGGIFNFIPLWPDEHAKLDSFRHIGG